MKQAAARARIDSNDSNYCLWWKRVSVLLGSGLHLRCASAEIRIRRAGFRFYMQ